MKTKLLLNNLKDLIFLANNQLAEGHAEASAMVIKHAIDKFQEIESSLGELEELLAQLQEVKAEPKAEAEVKAEQ